MGGQKRIEPEDVQEVVEIVEEHEIKQEVKQEAKMDIAKQLLGVVAAIIPVLTLFGVQPEWLTMENANAIVMAFVILGSFIYNLYAIWKNHYTSKKAQEQKVELKKKGLK